LSGDVGLEVDGGSGEVVDDGFVGGEEFEAEFLR
jgi:hypothetical protein